MIRHLLVYLSTLSENLLRTDLPARLRFHGVIAHSKPCLPLPGIPTTKQKNNRP